MSYEYVKHIVEVNPSEIWHLSDKLKAIWLGIDDEKGQSVFEFSKDEYRKLKTLIKNEISSRPNPLGRVAYWE